MGVSYFMSKLVIEGSRKLKGEVSVQGAKNSILPILAATLMCEGESVIHRCPEISDVYIAIKILKHLGCKVSFDNNTIIVNSKNISKNYIPHTLMCEMRSSIIFLGALISSLGKAKLSLPGGC